MPDAAPDPTAAGVPVRPKRFLLIGWDAADWKIMRPLIDAGQMPNMKRFLDEGTSGNVSTLQPALSPMLWTSIATGKLADKHGVLGFAEPDEATGKARPVTSTGRRCKAIWNILSDTDRPAGAVNWYASHPAEPIEGFVVTDRFAQPVGPLKPDEPLLGWPTVANSVWPDDDLEALAAVRVHPGMIDQAMVREFIPMAGDPESAKWPKVSELRVLLAHCASIHNAATAYIAERPWDFLGIYYDAIDRFAHAFMEFHPPRMDHVSEEDDERYSGVMDACYRFHDLMLGRLMKLIDDDTAVCIVSDHGFHCDHLRPSGSSAIRDGRPVAWHRPQGVLAFWGPGIRKQSTLFGASLLDITPTILNALGLAHADDMDGRPLMQIWDTQPESIDRVPSYERPGETPEAERGPPDIAAESAMLEQLRQLGYLGADDAEDLTIDRLRNLGTVYQSTGRPQLAAQQFREILTKRPTDKGARLALIGSMIAMGQLDEAEAALAEIEAEEGPNARVTMTRSAIAATRGDHDASLAFLRSLDETERASPAVQSQLGGAFMRAGSPADAEQAFDAALAADPEDVAALDGLGQVYFATGRAEDAVLAHTRAIALEHHRPMSHFNLARALAAVGRPGWALEAIAVTLRMAPSFAAAHELAAQIYENLDRNPGKAAFHRARAEAIRSGRTGLRAHESADAAPIDAPAGSSTRDADPAGEVAIVSGLPRSGTSLMMQMLAAGGVPILTDHERAADEDNPKGYYELESVKQTARDPGWLDGAKGKAVKLVHVLLRSLPEDHKYAVIVMRRDLDEMIASQRRMLERHGRGGGGLTDDALRQAYARDIARTLTWLGRQRRFRFMQVSYNELMADPGPQIARVRAFLGRDLDEAAMLACVDAGLYRNRSES